MIDVKSETLCSLAEAASSIPGRGSRPISVDTVRSWITIGRRGERLEAARLGGRWITSREAIQRFSDRLSAAALGGPGTEPPTQRGRRAAAERADAELIKMGL